MYIGQTFFFKHKSDDFPICQTLIEHQLKHSDHAQQEVHLNTSNKKYKNQANWSSIQTVPVIEINAFWPWQKK